MHIRPLLAAPLVCALAACTTNVPRLPTATLQSHLGSPPATSAIDHTVSIELRLADSFDVSPNGSCVGRAPFDHMGAGLRAQLTGRTTGLGDDTRATAQLENLTVGQSARFDDGLYCVIRLVFAPAMPDPDGYRLRFPGSQHNEVDLGEPSRGLGPIFVRGEPVDEPTVPRGYGRYSSSFQSCPSTLDPPDKDCTTAMS